METTEATILRVKPDSALVGFLKVMADVKEAGSAEGVSKVTHFSVSGNQTGEPIVGHANGWNILSLAAIFKDSLAEDSDLMDNITWLSIWVWAWEDVSVMKEYYLHTFDHSLVNTKSHSSTNVNMDIVDIFDASWILSEVSSLAFSISLIVWRNNDDLLTKVSKTNS